MNIIFQFLPLRGEAGSIMGITASIINLARI